jgi:tetratricopeptide (TPR) repeat protein
MTSEEPWILAGKRAEELGQYERALEIYVDALAHSPSEYGHASAYDIATAIWRYSEAYKIIVDGVTRFPNDPLLVFRYGRALAHRSDFDRAIQTFGRAISLGYPATEGIASIATAYITMGNVERAREAIARIPTESEYGKLANAELLLAIGNISASADILLKMAAQDELSFTIVQPLSQELMKARQQREALRLLVRAWKRRPNDPGLQFSVCLAMVNTGDFVGAAHNLTPTTRSDWLIRGSIAYANGDFVGAAGFMQPALEAENVQALQIFAYCALKTRAYKAALQGYIKLMWLDQCSAKSKVAVMYAARKCGNWKVHWMALFATKKLLARYGYSDG